MNTTELQNILGVKLPDDIVELLETNNGFRGPTDCPLLYSTDEIAKINISFKSEPWFPPAFRQYIILGDDGCGNWILWIPDNGNAMIWNPADGDWIQEQLPSVQDIWQLIEQWYEETEMQIEQDPHSPEHGSC